MDLSEHLRTQLSIDNSAARTQPANHVTVEHVAEALRALHRTVICRPECVDQIRLAVETEGLASSVNVVASDFVPEGEAWISRSILPRRF